METRNDIATSWFRRLRKVNHLSSSSLWYSSLYRSTYSWPCNIHRCTVFCYQPTAAERRMIIYSVVCACVRMCVCLSIIISRKQNISETNLWIFAKFTTDTPFVLYPGNDQRLVQITIEMAQF